MNSNTTLRMHASTQSGISRPIIHWTYAYGLV